MRIRISYLKFGESQWVVVVVRPRRGVKILAMTTTWVDPSMVRNLRMVNSGLMRVRGRMRMC